ncbi:hypothetical protein E3J49_07245 [Candidatus Bathyarchaeota archaeon]|nr:MAG: hypothetical protein E3J49_07245 [Candidatus Bathyarchaeota archaeon]
MEHRKSKHPIKAGIFFKIQTANDLLSISPKLKLVITFQTVIGLRFLIILGIRTASGACTLTH